MIFTIQTLTQVLHNNIFNSKSEESKYENTVLPLTQILFKLSITNFEEIRSQKSGVIESLYFFK